MISLAVLHCWQQSSKTVVAFREDKEKENGHRDDKWRKFFASFLFNSLVHEHMSCCTIHFSSVTCLKRLQVYLDHYCLKIPIRFIFFVFSRNPNFWPSLKIKFVYLIKHLHLINFTSQLFNFKFLKSRFDPILNHFRIFRFSRAQKNNLKIQQFFFFFLSKSCWKKSTSVKVEK